jgi:hypothetical protein
LRLIKSSRRLENAKMRSKRPHLSKKRRRLNLRFLSKKRNAWKLKQAHKILLLKISINS